MGTGKNRLSRYKISAAAILAVVSCALSPRDAAAAVAIDVDSPQITAQVNRLLADADNAMKAGQVNLALIQLKNAVQLDPRNGEIRARLGIMSLQAGQAAAAERELRQAQSNQGPYEIIVPALLRTMLQRNEFKELLAEFPDPGQGTQDKTTVDVLNARAFALQASGRPQEARAAMDHSLGLRRDVNGLIASARLAEQQADHALARRQADEAIKLSPTNEEAWTIKVLLAGQSGDLKTALAGADEFIQRVPHSTIARVTRIEVLLELKADARAKQEVGVLLKESPNSPYGPYLRGVVMARAGDFKGAWQQVQNLQPDFVQSEAGIAMMVASIAVSSGNAETGGSILTTLIASHPELRDPRLQLATLRLSQNAPQAAVDALAPLKASNDPEVHALLAQGYLMLRRFDQAIASFEIAKASPQAGDLVKQQLALSQLQVGDAEEASKGLREILQRDPRNAALAAALITALVGASKWDEAMGVADGLAKQAPKSPLPPLYRGQILVARGNLAEGMAEFDKVLALDPKFVPALYYRANASAARGDSEEAKKDLQLILAQSPANMLAYIRLTQIAVDHGQDQEALAWLDRAMKAAPKDPAPRLALANYQTERGRYPDAQAAVNGLLEVSPNNAEALALKGNIQLLRGQTMDAVKTFRALTASNTTLPVAYVLLAKALAATKDQFSAEEAAKRAIELAPDSAEVQKELIDIEIGGGKDENALETARNYANNYPGSSADLLLADTLVRLQRAKEAEAVLDKSLSSKPDAGVALRLSEVAMSAGNSKKASTVLADWVAKNPDDFDTRTAYAALLTEGGEVAAGRKEYEAVLKQRPNDAIVLNNLGLLLQKDDPARALALVSLAAKIAPRSSEIADSLGWLKYQRRDQQGALPLLQRAHNLDADNAPISYHLAVVLDATGKRAEAKTLLQTTLAKYPKFAGADEAKQMLARW